MVMDVKETQITPTLNRVKMVVIKTARNGVVNEDTLFEFSEEDNAISAVYSGGKIAKGFLVGTRVLDNLSFSYCQLQTDGKLDNGSSHCYLKLNEEGKIQLVENFEWQSRPGENGINIFQQIN